MTNIIKTISIDFDHTLSRLDVQKYAKDLIARGVNVWVVTARYDDLHTHMYEHTEGCEPHWNNDDLWEVIENVGISKNNVRFMNLQPKYKFLYNSRVIWHLDDKQEELDYIKESGIETIGIDVTQKNWKRKCNKLLKSK